MVARASSQRRLLAVVRPEASAFVDGLADALSAAFVDAEYEISVAESVAEATAAVGDEADAADPIDCVLTQDDLVDGTAVEVLDRVRAHDPDVPVVALVRAVDGRVPAELVTADFTACLPFEEETVPFDEVAERVARAVSTRGAPPTDGISLSRNDIFDQLFERLPLHVYVKNRAGRIAHVTSGPVTERLHPFAAEFEGKRDIDGVVPLTEGVDSYVDDLLVVATGEPVVDREEYFSSTGRWFLTTKIPLVDDDREVAGLLGVAREITDRKERERQLDALSHLVRHNLRNDVNVIRGWAGSLSQEMDEPHQSRMDRIIRASNRLLSTIDKQQELVDIITRHEEPVAQDVVAVCREAAGTVATRHPTARINVDCAVDQPHEVRAAPSLGRAVEELVENAVVHNPAAEPSVDLIVESVGDAVRIQVVDSGPEIPAVEVDIISGERAPEPLAHGSGLGLWMVRWIVRRSGGTLSFESGDDGGNRVVMTVSRSD